MRARPGLSLLFAATLLQVPAIGAPARGEFPFQLKEGFIWVKVRAPQSAEPLNFLLDSGASVSVINLRTAQSLGLKLGKQVSVQGVGASREGFWPEHLSANAGGVHLPGDYLAVDLGALSGACECRADGLIGADFFRGRVVQIDFAAGKIWVLGEAPATAKQESIPLKLRHGALRVPVGVNGGTPRWVRLDTGCASGLQWVSNNAKPEGPERRVAVALSELSVAVAQSRVQLGDTFFEAVPTDLHPKPVFADEAGLLGNGLLSRFGSVIIDTKGGRLILEGRWDHD
jgi:hypothetical protein